MNSDWVTPQQIVAPLGEFDLDPAATCRQAHDGLPWMHAPRQLCRCQDGLGKPWQGRIWLNPPYERPLTEQFVRRLAEHGNGVALVMARTDSAWFQEWVLGRGSAVLFLRHRPHFYTPGGERMADRAMTASVLVAYGRENVEWLERSGLDGKILCVA